MLIDIVFLVVIAIAAFKGTQRGFIIAVFSMIAMIIGLAAALKLSTVAAGYLRDSVDISARWLPLVSFILVFLIVVLIVRLVANLIQKTVEVASLGWLNRLAGALFYIIVYTIVFSVLLFFAKQLHLLEAETIADSKVYLWVEPLGPRVIDGIGKIIPFFQDMFQELKAFFEDISKQDQPK